MYRINISSNLAIVVHKYFFSYIPIIRELKKIIALKTFYLQNTLNDKNLDFLIKT